MSVESSIPSGHALANIDGWPINVATLSQAVPAIIRAAAESESFSVVTLNLDHLVKLRRSASFRRAYSAARFVTADGAPVAALARLQNPAIERTTGADLLLPLIEAAAKARVPVFFFGSNAGVLARAGRDLAQRCEHKLDIAGTAAPSMQFNPESPEADAALDRIAASGAKLCILALGAPKQEILAARAVARGIKVGFVSAGAGLDYLAGEQTRAPKSFQNFGLEWLWRLGANPRRLAVRYARCAVLLLDLGLLTPLRHWLAGRRI